MNELAATWYSPDTAAQLLGVSTKTIYRQIERGLLEVRRVGSRIVISDKALTEMLDKAGRRDG